MHSWASTATKKNKVKLLALWVIPGLFALFIPISTQAITQSLSVVVKLAPETTLQYLETQSTLSQIQPVYPFETQSSISSVYRAEFSGTSEQWEKLASDPHFIYVTSDEPVEAAEIFLTDPTFTSDATVQDKLWWLPKTGTLAAWEIERGSKDIKVAVVDTGIDGLHEDLNDGRVGAGYVTYCQIQDAATGKCLVHIASTIPAGSNSDDHGHGTIVAGIIGAIPNNAKGVAGMNWEVRILPVKVLDSNGAGVASDVAAGVTWAVDQGADIINMSLGGNSLEGTPLLNEALKYALEKSVVVVAAAGNDAALIGADLDIKPVFPVCSDGGENRVLGVAAVDINDRKASFSNFGRACIDVSAPGTAHFTSREDQKGILSTYFDPKQPTKNNIYVFASGTSMAAPIVSGAAALLKAHHPDLSGAALRDRIIASVDTVDVLNLGACAGLDCAGRMGLGRINVAKALQTTTINSDNILKDSSGKLYLVENGVRRPVSEFVLKQRALDTLPQKIVSASELESIPQGQALPPLDGTLVKGTSLPTIYQTTDGVLLPVSYLAFRSFNLSFDQVETVSDLELATYRKGPNLVPANGALLKLSDSPAVYFLHEGKRRLISLFTFKNRSFDFSQVVEVLQEEFDRYPEDLLNTLEPPLDGTLVRSQDNPAVYVFESGMRRLLSAQAFATRGYSFSQVGVLTEGELSQYILGSPIQ